MNILASACLSSAVLVLMPATATACSPAPGFTPLTVEQLYRGATYVLYAEGGKPVSSPDGERVSIKVVEHFKGPPLDSVPAYENSCDRTPRPGVAEVLFLDPNGRGHTMAYPSGQSVEQILAALRRLKTQIPAGETPSSLPDK